MCFLKLRFVAVVGVSLALAAQLASAAPLKVGDPFPDLGRFRLEGKLPESLAGRVVIVDFWASWCGPCRASFPVMEQLHKEYGPKGVVLIGVNHDDSSRDMEEFLRKYPVSFAVLRDAAKKLVATADIATMPTSFVINRAGKVHSVHNGFLGEATRKQYIQEIEQLLSAKP